MALCTNCGQGEGGCHCDEVDRCEVTEQDAKKWIADQAKQIGCLNCGWADDRAKQITCTNCGLLETEVERLRGLYHDESIELRIVLKEERELRYSWVREIINAEIKLYEEKLGEATYCSGNRADEDNMSSIEAAIKALKLLANKF
jgi:hypothetical protein